MLYIQSTSTLTWNERVAEIGRLGVGELILPAYPPLGDRREKEEHEQRRREADLAIHGEFSLEKRVRASWNLPPDSQAVLEGLQVGGNHFPSIPSSQGAPDGKRH